MPLTLTVSEGVLPSGKEKQVFKGLCDLMLKWHGILGNKVMTPNVVGSIHVIPEKYTFSGGDNKKVAFIEWKVPSFVFASTEIQQGYCSEATALLLDAAGGSIAQDSIWINVIHAVDGAWGIGGSALNNAQLKDAISQG
jgi:hypothetical protein